MEKQDCVTYYNCVSGNCPWVSEEEKDGRRTWTGKECCGDESGCGCKNCYFHGSGICEECIHKEIGR